MMRNLRTICLILVVVCINTLVLRVFDGHTEQKMNNDKSPVKTDIPHQYDQRKCGIRAPAMIEKWTPATALSEYQGLPQTSDKLAKHICDSWLVLPSNKELSLNRPNKRYFGQKKQDKLLDDLFQHKRKGFYVECGAAGGENYSNTLFFERERDWDGLLIEANPKSFRSLLSKHRRAYAINAGLSPTSTSQKSTFLRATVVGGLKNYLSDHHMSNIHEHNEGGAPIEVQCFPLYSILKAMNISHVDFFSLDVEGPEYEIVLSLPLDHITIDVFIIEYVIGGNAKNTEKLDGIIHFLVDVHGYRVVGIHKPDIILQRQIYIH